MHHHGGHHHHSSAMAHHHQAMAMHRHHHGAVGSSGSGFVAVGFDPMILGADPQCGFACCPMESVKCSQPPFLPEELNGYMTLEEFNWMCEQSERRQGVKKILDQVNRDYLVPRGAYFEPIDIGNYTMFIAKLKLNANRPSVPVVAPSPTSVENLFAPSPPPGVTPVTAVVYSSTMDREGGVEMVLAEQQPLQQQQQQQAYVPVVTAEIVDVKN